MRKFLVPTILILIVVASIVFGNGSGKNRNLLGSRAFEGAESVDGTKHTSNVLLIILNPSENGEDLASRYYKNLWEGMDLSSVKTYIPQVQVNAFKKLSENKISYRVMDVLDLTNWPQYKNGFQFSLDEYQHCRDRSTLSNGLKCEDQKWQFDAPAFISQNQICQKAGAIGATEIWLLTSPYVTAYESFMIGPGNGFWINGPVYEFPECQKNMAVMNLDFTSLVPMTHVYGHRVEQTLRYLNQNWVSKQRKIYVENFLNSKRYDQNPDPNIYYPPWPEPGCGNAHFPLNGRKHYDYGSKKVRSFDCPDWANIPNFTKVVKSMNCSEWDCNDTNWGSYWLGSIPMKKGTFDVKLIDGRTVKMKKDWWGYILYPDSAIAFHDMTNPVLLGSESPELLNHEVVD